MSVQAVEADEIDAQHVLRDVMYIIASHLELPDLTKLSKVCKSWRDEALREIKNRHLYIQHLYLPVTFANCKDSLDLDPSLSLSFYKINSRNDKWYTELENSIKNLPHKAIALAVRDCFATEDPDCKLVEDCNTLSFFLPNVQSRARVQATDVPSRLLNTVPGILQSSDEECTIAMNEVVENLKLNDPENPSSAIIICFSNSWLYLRGRNVAGLLFDRIQRNNEVMMFSTTYITSSNCTKEISRPCMSVIKISGSNIQAYTTTIHYATQIDEFERKLKDLKKRVKPRRYYSGLFYGYYNSCGNSEHPLLHKEKVKSILKRIYPNVPFVGTFTGDYCDVIDNDPEGFTTRLHRDVSIMIISYD